MVIIPKQCRGLAVSLACLFRSGSFRFRPVVCRRVVRATGDDGNDANDDKNTPTSELVCDASERCGVSVRNTVDAYAQKADDVFDVVGVAVVVSARSRRVVKRRA